MGFMLTEYNHNKGMVDYCCGKKVVKELMMKGRELYE